MFVAMAAMLVVALCVPEAFDDRALGLTLAAAYGVVRAAHIGLFAIASTDDPELRRAVDRPRRAATVAGVALVAGAALLDGWVQGAGVGVALAVDMAVPLLFGSDGWHLEPRHFAERHGLIVLIALGESIVALGVGTSVGLDRRGHRRRGAGRGAGRRHVVVVLRRRLAAGGPPPRGDPAREGPATRWPATPTRCSTCPIVAGVVLVALALEHVLSHVTEPLDDVASVALGGGVALFLFGQIAFKRRMTGLLARQRVVPALVLVPRIPLFRVGRRVGVAGDRRGS